MAARYCSWPRLRRLLLLTTAIALAFAARSQAQTSIRVVENPAQRPIQFRLGNVNVDDAAFFTVPAGTRLVIEFVSALGQTNEFCAPLSINIQTTVGGITLLHSLAPSRVFTGFANQTVFAVSQQTRIYGDPGTIVIASAVSAFTQLTSECQSAQSVTFSGHLVSLR